MRSVILNKYVRDELVFAYFGLLQCCKIAHGLHVQTQRTMA